MGRSFRLAHRRVSRIADPTPGCERGGNDQRRFLIRDPTGVRHPVVSLRGIDNLTGHASGLRTAFRINPFDQYLTTQHVLEAWLN